MVKQYTVMYRRLVVGDEVLLHEVTWRVRRIDAFVRGDAGLSIDVLLEPKHRPDCVPVIVRGAEAVALLMTTRPL